MKMRNYSLVTLMSAWYNPRDLETNLPGVNYEKVPNSMHNCLDMSFLLVQCRQSFLIRRWHAMEEYRDNARRDSLSSDVAEP